MMLVVAVACDGFGVITEIATVLASPTRSPASGSGSAKSARAGPWLENDPSDPVYDKGTLPLPGNVTSTAPPLTLDLISITDP
jgi:hypothetical protein